MVQSDHVNAVNLGDSPHYGFYYRISKFMLVRPKAYDFRWDRCTSCLKKGVLFSTSTPPVAQFLTSSSKPLIPIPRIIDVIATTHISNEVRGKSHNIISSVSSAAHTICRIERPESSSTLTGVGNIIKNGIKRSRLCL
jgi:hypothetical protein